MALIEVNSLSKVFVKTTREKGLRGAVKAFFHPQTTNIVALNSVSFHVNQGEILGYIGPNGAGKSTTVKVLTGILTPTDGEALVDGIRPYEKRQENAKKIGFVYGQRSRLWRLLPVYDSLEYSKILYTIPDDVYKENISYFKESLDLKRILNQPVRTLSLGERMRAELAMAMLHNPKILYLDEPTVGLDVVGKNELRKIIRKINNERNVTVFLVTHDVLDIEKLCSRVLVLDKGQLLWEGSIKDMKKANESAQLITVEYSGPSVPIENDGMKLLSREGDKYHYRYDPKKVPIREALDHLAAGGKIVAFNVTEPEIEEIIRDIYTR